EAIAIQDGACVVRGWFVDTEGAVPSGLSLELDGQRHVMSTMERVRRPDVMRHFGLGTDECGFLATIPLPPGFATLQSLGAAEASGLAGETPDYTHVPLRIAAVVASQLKPAGESAPAPAGRRRGSTAAWPSTSHSP